MEQTNNFQLLRHNKTKWMPALHWPSLAEVAYMLAAFVTVAHYKQLTKANNLITD